QPGKVPLPASAATFSFAEGKPGRAPARHTPRPSVLAAIWLPTLAGLVVGVLVGLALAQLNPSLGLFRRGAHVLTLAVRIGTISGGLIGVAVGLFNWLFATRRRSLFRPAFWSLTLPVAAGIFVVVFVVGSRWLRGGEAIFVSADDPELQ